MRLQSDVGILLDGCNADCHGGSLKRSLADQISAGGGIRVHAGFRLAFRMKRHRRAQRRRVTTSPKIPLVYTKISTVPNSSGGW